MIEIGRRKLAVCLSFSSLIAESSFIDLDTYGPVSVAERHSVKGAAVNLLYCKEIVVYRSVEDSCLYDYVLEHVVCHHQALMHELKGREEDVLQELELAVVAVRHVAAEHADLVLCGHDPVAVAPHDFPYVRILLMRHDARSGGKLVRELDEAVIRAHVHAAVCGELVECQCYRSHCRCYRTL